MSCLQSKYFLQGILTYPAPAKKEEEEEEKPGDRFEGCIAHGQREGKGKYTWSNGCYYDGDYKNHMRHGHGVLTFPDKGRYEGWSCNQPLTIAQPHQAPESTSVAANCFLSCAVLLDIGGWSENKMHGEGLYVYANGDMYTGAFQQGIKHGHGSYFFKVRSDCSKGAVQAALHSLRMR